MQTPQQQVKFLRDTIRSAKYNKEAAIRAYVERTKRKTLAEKRAAKTIAKADKKRCQLRNKLNTKVERAYAKAMRVILFQPNAQGLKALEKFERMSFTE